ncbi:hypothetical protein M3588_21460 [Cytobacillus sp. AMY 15.2]|nr:hypothetical protein [Cytobacillus sp. AMY 15.2]
MKSLKNKGINVVAATGRTL